MWSVIHAVLLQRTPNVGVYICGFYYHSKNLETVVQSNRLYDLKELLPNPSSLKVNLDL
jgi:hypothetical protein